MTVLSPPSWSPKLWDHVAEGIELSLWTCCLTILLEIWSIETVKRVMEQKGAGPRLYVTAVFSNLRNHIFFGAPIYVLATEMFCRRTAESLGIRARIVCIATILLVQSLCFYAIHRLFHTYPSLYMHHKFHHRFNVHVTPIAANAVSPVEYIFAYILPFVVAMPFVEADSLSIRFSVSIVSFTNILIHTPKLEELWDKMLPEWIVSTHDHLEHHRKLNMKYAAPTFNIDYFVSFIERQPAATK